MREATMGPRPALILAFLALGATLADAAPRPDAVMQEPVVRVLNAAPERTVVQITFPVERAPADWRGAERVEWQGVRDRELDPRTGEPVRVAPEFVRTIAVPGRGLPAWQVTAVDWLREPADGAAAPVDVTAPAVHRGVPLAGLVVHPEAGGGVLGGVVVEVRHRGLPAAKGRSDERAARRARREPVPGGVLNPDLYRELRAASASAPPPREKDTHLDAFALADQWVRLEVDATGVYRVTGSELAAMGVALDGIAPDKVRLFKGGGLVHADDPEAEPDDLQARTGLTEIAVQLRGMGDGEWNVDDFLVFYGFGTAVWADRLDPDAGPLDHFEHPHEAFGVYWLTWEDDVTPSPFPGDALRVTTVEAQPVGDTPRTTHRARYHGEESLAPATGMLEDNWAWDAAVLGGFQKSFRLDGVVPDQPATFEIQLAGVYETSVQFPDSFRVRAYFNGNSLAAVDHAWAIQQQFTEAGMRFGGETMSLEPGLNTVHLDYENYPETGRLLNFDRFQLAYPATLNKNDYEAELACAFWGDEVPAPGTPVDVRFTLPATGDHDLWDVTAPPEVRRVQGVEASGATRTLTVGWYQDPHWDRHFVLFDDDDLRSVASAARVQPTPLRETLTAADYLVIHPPAFAQPAGQLAGLRSRTLPGVDDPVALAVDVEDVYANFSGGQKDWRAIQRFLRWYFLEFGQRLRWVCLLGDASIDYRNHFGRQPGAGIVDWIPTDLVTNWPGIVYWLTTRAPYTTDDTLVSLDSPPVGRPEVDLPDIAVGRLPASTVAEAQDLVDRVVTWVEDTPPGPWRNRVLMSADDMHRPSEGDPDSGEEVHTIQAERLSTEYVPASVEVDKIYMVDYPLIGIYKPDARRDLLARLNEGTTAFYFVGHGAAVTLADEQLFQITDIAGLNNGDRRFVFMAFSCDVGVYADPNSQCMAEDFLTAGQGGGIGSIAASWVSLSNSNDLLSNAFFGAYYPGRHVDAAVSLSEALVDGKIAMAPSTSLVRNARRYNFLGDPALRLPNPVDDVRFAEASSDSLLTGRLHEVRPEIELVDIPHGPNTTYELLVQESPIIKEYTAADGDVHTWRSVPNTVFRGNGALADLGTFIPFLAPQSMRTGEEGRFRLIVDHGEEVTHAAFRQVPVAQVAASSGGDVTGPAIDLAFEGGRVRVQPGTPLEAALVDTNGINILATNPANSVLLEFDRSGIYNNVSDDVVFESGSYTRARLETSLPADLAVGEHTVVMTASDMFGNVGSDTLSFTLEAAGVAAMRNATVFPNPTAGPCRLLCDLTGPMTVRWDIYTVSGRRIRRVEDTFVNAGPAILEWDGRDGEGDTIANGVYLYVLRGRMPGDDHELRETGQLVIMR